jgi:small subunit ribosomal protein S18
VLRRFLDDRNRIRKARQTGNCRRHQSRVATAIKRSREIALVAYVAD